ncbi:inhibitor of Bruton tyrosine kinase-like [Acropora palmata]|uniref:inhibitor of Bruton tyrosine kinase-like n=1 Tax=Acropora palmata TaxID=6131 RepID=UPI003DA050C7
MNYSPKCRLSKHDDLNFCTVLNVGEEYATKVRALLPRLCSNFAHVKDQCGRNALHLAASSGKWDILEWLVTEHAADVNSKDEESGWTSLHRSVFYGYLDCTVKLIQLGADLNCLDNEGLSPLDLILLDSPIQRSGACKAKVVSSHKTSRENELTLCVGDMVKNIVMTGDKYWNGCLNGKWGSFPGECVELQTEDYTSAELFTWGVNTNFTLGHRDENMRHTPEMLHCPSGDSRIFIKEVAMCKFHTVFLSSDGRVLTCGHGNGGRLGHGNQDTILEPREVELLRDVKCAAIAAGEDHTVVVTADGSVYTFGLNNSQQLGHVPVPLECLAPKLVEVKSWSGKTIIVGASAGRYHSVFYTLNEVYSCGLNAGQLGHIKQEKYQPHPRKISYLADENLVISKVTCSEAATVCATTKGDVFLFNLYTCRRIMLRFTGLMQLTVVGGELDCTSTNNIGRKFADELVVTALNLKGKVFQWRPGFNSARECRWEYNHPVQVRDFAIGKQFLIVSDRGEAFYCRPNQTNFEPVKVQARKRNRTSSTSQMTSESAIAHSPPRNSPLRKEKHDRHAQSHYGSSHLNLLVEEESKKDVLRFHLERIRHVHRGVRVFTDSESRGFALLQVSPKQGLNTAPNVRPTLVWRHLTQLLEETTCEDDIHDVEFLVKGRTIPAHGFVLASRSQYCHQLICENIENRQGEADERTKTIPLNENVDYIAFLSWLRRLYSGGDICDEEVFVLKDVVGKGKNGYHNLNEGGSKETNKTVNEMGKELDEEEMLSSRVLADLLFLAKTDRDVFPAPTCEEDEGFVQDSEDDVSEDDCTCLETRPLKKSEETMTKRDRENKGNALSVRGEANAFSRLNCPELYDVVIVCEDGSELQCHKCILVARLDYFRSMFAGDWLEAVGGSKTVTLSVPAITLQIVLDFIYTGQAGRIQETGNLEVLEKVLVVADQMLIYRLKEICEAAIANRITLTNATKILEFSLLYNANQLRDVCTEFITNNLVHLIETRTLNSLSDEALAETSRAYRSLIKGMPWRVITPSDPYETFANENREQSPRKLRKSGGRKKSSRSESEQDGVKIPDQPVQDTQAEEKVEGSIIQDMDEVFEEHKMAKSESPAMDENIIDDHSTVQPGRQEDQASPIQTGDASGHWYRKNSPEADGQSKKRARDKKKPAKSLGDGEEKEEGTASEKGFSPETPAWSNQTSIPSPPAASLRDIIEQEQSKAALEAEFVVKVSPSSGKCHQSASGQRSPQASGALRWISGGHLSQKQRRRSKSKTFHFPEEEEKEREVGGEQDKPIPVAWGGVSKEPSPVKSLRDLMQEEEQRLSENKQESQDLPPASPRAHSSSGKSGCTTNKLNVWQVSPVAGSPPSWSVAFSSIIESQEIENTTLERVNRKPFHLTQLEEKAMEELLQHYGGQDNACEFVTVQRIGSTIAKPVWKKERSLSVNSN